MGIYSNASVSSSVTSVEQRLNTVNSFFDGLDGVSSEIVDYTYDENDYSVVKITIDGTNIEAGFGLSLSSFKDVITYAKDGDNALLSDLATTGHSAGGEGNLNMAAYVDIDDGVVNAILISITQVFSTDSLRNGIQLLYVKTTDNKYLIGYSRFKTNNNSVLIDDISTLVYEEVGNTSKIAYAYSNMFPFYAKEGTVDFLNQAYFKNGNSLKSFTTDILKECSTVSLLSTISLPSPLNNNIALGAHCIAPLDDEEVSE
ncbi:MAG: hypothetical protein J6Y02_20825 [Pseudobutyrivibrio sp.]|nr:hypothetical protein [Pseudobutyrivibrio sp.]